MLTSNRVPLVMCWMTLSALGQEVGPDPAYLTRVIASKFATVTEYTFDGDLELARKSGEEGHREDVLRSKVKLAVAPEGKYLLWAGDQDNLQYILVSNGADTWAYMPGTNQYVKRRAGAAGVRLDPEEVFQKGVADEDRELISPSLLVVPLLAHLAQSAALVEMNKSADVNYKGEYRQLPILSVLSNKDDTEHQTMTEVTVEPESSDIIRLEWTKSIRIDEEQRFALLSVSFEKLQIGEPLPPSFFTFEAGGILPVKELPIPGLDGSSILNRAAPDFELESANGPRVHLADFRARTVVLAFYASWCVPCREQFEALARIQEEYKDKALSVFAIGTEGKAVAARFAGQRDLSPTFLDDPTCRIHRLYRVRFLPTIVVIDPKGQVVRFDWGEQNAEALKEFLKGAGLPDPPPR